ncbi:MAG: BamA/TamA family outer membrane protein [Ekhidna sp.]
MYRGLIVLLLFPFFGYSQQSDSTANESSFAIFPAISYAPETSLQFGGAAIWVLGNSDTSQSSFQRQSTLTPFFIYTIKKQAIAAVNLDYYFPSGKNLTASMRYYNFPDSYYGVGNDRDPDVSEMYTNRFFQIEGQLLHPFNEKVFVGIAFDFHFTSLREKIPNGMLESDAPVGLEGGNVAGIGPSFRYDTRDYTLYPTKGYFISSRLLFNEIGDFSFTSYLADFRKYIDLKDQKHILAFQFRTQLTFGTGTPFYKLPQLGGDERLRGIANASLYRDRQMMYTQVEYRRPLFWRFGMTLFAGIGDVAFDVDDFNPSEFKYVAGIGGRLAIIPERRLNARLDIGIARGGQTGIYIGISEAF